LDAIQMAMEQSDFGAVMSLIERIDDPNVVDKSGERLIHTAISNSHEDMILLLIKKQADINLKDPFNNTPLHLAIFNENLSIIELLMANKANPNIKGGPDNKTPFFEAKKIAFSGKKDRSILNIITNRKLHSANNNNEKAHPLPRPPYKIEMMEDKIPPPIPPRDIDEEPPPLPERDYEIGEKPLKPRVQHKDKFLPPRSKDLANRSIPPQKRRYSHLGIGTRGQTSSSNSEINNNNNENKDTVLQNPPKKPPISQLKKYKPKRTNLQNPQKVPTNSQSKYSKPKLTPVDKLVNECMKHVNPLHCAVIEGGEIVQLVLDKNVDIEIKNTYQHSLRGTPLHEAVGNAVFHKVQSNYYTAAEVLINNKANIEAVDEQNRTPLYQVVYSCGSSFDKSMENVTRLLLENKASTNCETNIYGPLLYLSIENRNIPLTKLLLEYKANPRKYHYGRTLAKHAKDNDMDHVIKEHDNCTIS